MARIASKLDTASRYMVAFFLVGPAIMASSYASHIHPEKP